MFFSGFALYTKGDDGLKAFFYTLGCKVNAVETDSMAALLQAHGYTRTDRPEEADVIVLNSCTVTASGDSRMLKALRKLRNTAPLAVIVLTGCYVQAFPEEAAKLTEPDILLGTKHRTALPDILESHFLHSERCTLIEPHAKGDAFETLPQGTDALHTRAFLKIQDGCDRFCTYCIIPFARGRCRSRSAGSIRAEAAQLYAAGFREIILCGINLACWEDNDADLAGAVQLCADAGFPRVRLGSLEPDGLTEDVLDRLSRIPALCPQFHISVQSGCDRILAAMHRHYDTAEFVRLVTSVRTHFSGAAVTTDIMTGFPGETDADHAETMRFVQEVQFSQMHVFRYSPRPGTKAASFAEQVPEAVKKARADELSALGAKLHEAFLHSCIGQTLDVLFERERGNGFHQGHAGNYAAVRVPDTDHTDWRGSIRRVRITGAADGQLLGEA